MVNQNLKAASAKTKKSNKKSKTADHRAENLHSVSLNELTSSDSPNAQATDTHPINGNRRTSLRSANRSSINLDKCLNESVEKSINGEENGEKTLDQNGHDKQDGNHNEETKDSLAVTNTSESSITDYDFKVNDQVW